jgi:outer membrane protein assembly factor BamB
VIVSGARELASYSAGTGEKLWWLNGLPYLQLTVPVLDRDTIYVNGSGIPADLSLEGWFQQLDKNKDGKIQLDEFPTMMGGTRTGTILDRDKDGAVDATEFKLAIDPLKGESSLWAVRLGGWGSLAEANVRWRATKGLPEVSSPLLYKDVLYLVKNGGILTTLNPATGEVLKQGRLQGALGEYFASPVAGDNQVFTVSGEGKVTVLKAGGEWEILAVNDLGEDCYTTPAITGGRIYIRTRSSLYSFGKR